MALTNKFYKVSETSFSQNWVTLWNPVTNEEKSELVWDIEDERYDDDDHKRELRFMKIDSDARRAWLHMSGVILEGDQVIVVKGRKLPIGYTGIVKTIKDWHDCYGRVQTTYVYFEDGKRTSITNCKLSLQ